MKVGILTFHWANNYGALFQAYCLCEALQGLGHEVRVIDYVPPGDGLRWWQGWGLHCGTPSLTLKRLRFDKFRRSHIPLTGPCRTIGQLCSVTAEFDAVIVGSDQVWNGNIVRTADLPYFLGFVDHQRCRLISYAASFGELLQPLQTTSAAGPLLRRFDAISVRDELSATLVRQLSGIQAQIVVDPTLLHEFANLFRGDVTGPGYIGVYYISKAHVDLGRKTVRRVKERLGLPVVTIGQPGKEVNSDREALSAGPLEWLTLLRKATFICTDSFHGVALAITSARPFIAWSGLRSDRVRSLLNACGAGNRLVDAADPAIIDEVLDTSIECGTLRERLSPLVRGSHTFLQEALTLETPQLAHGVARPT